MHSSAAADARRSPSASPLLNHRMDSRFAKTVRRVIVRQREFATFGQSFRSWRCTRLCTEVMSPTHYGPPDVPHLRQMPRIEAGIIAGTPGAPRSASSQSGEIRFGPLGGESSAASVGRIKRVDAQCSDNYRSLLCEVIDDFETCDELTAERGRTGPMDLRPCFPYQVGVGIQVDRNAVPRDELRDTHGFQCVSLIVTDGECDRADLLQSNSQNGRVHDIQAGSLSASDAYRPGNLILEKGRLS